MRLSTSTNIYFNRPDGSKAAIRQSVEACADAGYHVMDMNFHDCTTFKQPFVQENWREWIEDIASVAREKKIEFSQAHGPFYNFCDDAYADKAWHDEMIFRSIDCAEILSIPWVVFHAGTDFEAANSFRESMRKNREYFLPLLDYAEKHHVGIAIENLWDLNIAPQKRFTASAEELVELVELLDRPNLGICFDVEHAAIMRQNIPGQLRLIGDRLKATHVSDVINAASDHMLPFSGIINWAEFMQCLRDIDYKGDLTYEIHRYTAGLPDALVSAALRYSFEVGNYLLTL